MKVPPPSLWCCGPVAWSSPEGLERVRKKVFREAAALFGRAWV